MDKVLEQTLLHEAAKKGAADISKLLASGLDINAQDGEGNTPLEIAVMFAKADSVLTLISAGADVNIANSEGRSPIWSAAFSANVKWDGNKKISVIKSLIKAGADVNQEDSFGVTPLIAAIKMRPSSCVVIRLLLDAGADIEHKTNFGYTPLSSACKFLSVNVVKTLLKAGANPNSTDEDNLTPLQYICKRAWDVGWDAREQDMLRRMGDIAAILLSYGAASKTPNSEKSAQDINSGFYLAVTEKIKDKAFCNIVKQADINTDNEEKSTFEWEY